MLSDGVVRGDDHWTRRCPESVPRGERHPRTALRGTMREVALEMLAAGRSIRRIAKDLGVSRNAVVSVSRSLIANQARASDHV